jgi:hypothetical protein
MKIKPLFAPIAALPLLFVSLNASANAVTIDFIDLTENPGSSGFGESAWSTLSLPSVFGLEITGHATNDNAGDTEQFAYLDWGTAGLGVCKDASPLGANPGSGANRCAPSSDDNVTIGEFLEFTFDQDVVVENLWFNNNHDGGFGAGDMVTIDGMAFDVSTGYADGVNGIGSFSLLTDQVLRIAYNNEEFYVSGMAVSAVPVPAAIWLFGTALVGFIGLGRRRNIG